MGSVDEDSSRTPPMREAITAVDADGFGSVQSRDATRVVIVCARSAGARRIGGDGGFARPCAEVMRPLRITGSRQRSHRLRIS